MKIQVLIRLKPGVLDVQGKAIERCITESGVNSVSEFRVGRLIELDVDAANIESAQEIVKPLCEKLLANTIIENFEIKAI